jgi:2-C-methyl-D-erythritol 4-phosphate cytidylyltransferase
MKLILPVAGSSTRYPGLRPKWLLTHPNGNLMFHEAILGLDLSQTSEIVLVCREDHYEKFEVEQVVRRQFAISPIKVPYRIIQVAPTQSQPETVYAAIKKGQISGPIYIKDSDNYFTDVVRPGNRVASINLSQLSYVDAANKSYVELDSQDQIINIVEKHVISNTFCVGGYSFLDAKQFVQTFESLENNSSLYVSHIIFKLLMDGVPFENSNVSEFIDWGTLREWNRFRKEYATLFIDIDGCIVKNSGQFFSPAWGEAQSIPENVEYINRLYDSGKTHIVLSTSRSQLFADVTRKQLNDIGLRFHDIIFNLPHAKRILINDYSGSNPYPSAIAINLDRDSQKLSHLLASIFE